MDASYKNQTLYYGFSVGTKAIDTYDACCDLFGFKRSLRGNFAQQKSYMQQMQLLKAIMFGCLRTIV